MQPTVTFTGVISRSKVVSLIALVQKYTGLRLKESKEAVEQLLGGQHVDFVATSEYQADTFAAEARALGAIVSYGTVS